MASWGVAVIVVALNSQIAHRHTIDIFEISNLTLKKVPGAGVLFCLFGTNFHLVSLAPSNDIG
jgi:hypothetical protein